MKHTSRYFSFLIIASAMIISPILAAEPSFWDLTFDKAKRTIGGLYGCVKWNDSRDAATCQIRDISCDLEMRHTPETGTTEYIEVSTMVENKGDPRPCDKNCKEAIYTGNILNEELFNILFPTWTSAPLWIREQTKKSTINKNTIMGMHKDIFIYVDVNEMADNEIKFVTIRISKKPIQIHNE